MFEEKRENLEPVTHLPAEPEEVVSWYTPKSREGQEVRLSKRSRACHFETAQPRSIFKANFRG